MAACCVRAVPSRDPTNISYSSESCRSDERFGPLLCSFEVIRVLYPLWFCALLPVHPMSESAFEYCCSCRRQCMFDVRDIRFREYISRVRNFTVLHMA